MYYGITLKYLAVCLLGLIHHGGAASLNDTVSGRQPSAVYPQSRIVGGASAYEGQFPYQISLRRGGSHVCGGSIISANYVVTAAHCVTAGSPPTARPASTLSIRAGSRLTNAGGQVIGVSEVKVHPNYIPFQNDIALLKLSGALQFNYRVKAIPLASKDPPTGVPVITSGWGGLGDGSVPKVLQYNTLTALTQADCSRRLPAVPASVICLAHTSGNGVCNGDSGGPAMYRKKLVGITDYMVGGCGSTNPDGFASVAYHINWLKRNSDV